jgi:hypothetical protein
MALPTHIRLEFVTPERAIAHEDVDEVVLPGETGDFGVLPGHAPLLAMLRIGPNHLLPDGTRHDTKSRAAIGPEEAVADQVHAHPTDLVGQGGHWFYSSTEAAGPVGRTLMKARRRAHG